MPPKDASSFSCVEAPRSTEGQPDVTDNVDIECLDHGLGHVINMNEGTDFWPRSVEATEGDVGEDHHRSEHDGRHARALVQAAHISSPRRFDNP